VVDVGAVSAACGLAAADADDAADGGVADVACAAVRIPVTPCSSAAFHDMTRPLHQPHLA
jgi:hypothetical protein